MAGRLARLSFPGVGWAVATALLLRLAAVTAVEAQLAGEGREHVVAGDAGGYLDLAADIAAGRDYAVDSGVHPRRAMRVPLFPLLLAGPFWLTEQAGWVSERFLPALCRCVVALCGALAVWATGRLGAAIGGPRVGAAAAWLAAVNPLAVAFSTMLLSESLFAALLTLSLAGVAECVRRPIGDARRPNRWEPAIWAGLATAGACLTRPVWLPFLPCVALLALGLAWKAGDLRRAAWTGAFAAAFLVGFASWPLRNQRVLGEPVLTTTWGGPTLYDSLGPQATGASDMRFRDPPPAEASAFEGPYRPVAGNPWFDVDEGAVPPEDRPVFKIFCCEASPPARLRFVRQLGPQLIPLTEDERLRAAALGDELASNRLYSEAAREAALEDPLRVARLAVVKQGRFWRPWPVGGLPGGVAGRALKAGFAAFFLPLIGLAVWGGVRLWRDGGEQAGWGVDRLWALALTWGPVLGLAAVCLVFVGSVRYRLPGEFPLCVAAAVGGLDLWQRRRERSVRTGG
ncbi:ArnT family glycosyltransferase [Alienimonas sp. DA493]|uniref:ArnT family glycosyltransferase n=1 Tax=Alienimonas sp. DA493 TaxID=3373605 RepID=UPI00375479F5